MNNVTHPEEVQDLEAGTLSRQRSGDPWVTIHGETRGITGIRVTIDGEQTRQCYEIGRFSSDALPEGVNQPAGFIIPMATAPPGSYGPEHSETHAPREVGPLDFEQRSDAAQQAQKRISTKLHMPSDKGHLPHRGNETSPAAGSVQREEEEGTYPDWVVTMFQTMNDGDRQGQ